MVLDEAFVVVARRLASHGEVVERLRAVPEASLAYHAARNHFSKWLKARTEFALAQELRPKKLSDFASVEELRQTLEAVAKNMESTV